MNDPERGLIVAFSVFLPHAAIARGTVLRFGVEIESSVVAVDAPES